ncbi:polygalacturonase 1 beta-like protein 3 [Daucus carota subsp. sativus]|nr:PREDICTED: polygalacturonase 1 beta-like protein 3 [Daucus carota subsp. sativus]
MSLPSYCYNPVQILTNRKHKRMKLNSTSCALPSRSFFLLLSIAAIFSTTANAAPLLSTDESISKESPFAAKASLIRYWNKQISNNLPKPYFLLSKASPLSAVNTAFFSKLAASKNLNSHLSSFCSAANLFCLHSKRPPKQDDSAHFSFYSNRRFSNYGASRLSGDDSFKNYSGGNNFATASFASYSRGSTDHKEGFSSYAKDANVANSNFTSYAASTTGGSGVFDSYASTVNVPDLRFASYNSDANNHKLAFSSYVDDTNSGNEAFISYGKKGNAGPLEFTNYGTTSNVIGSTFTGYSESGNAANNSFKGYSSDANNPSNNFKAYGFGVNGGTDSFSSYRDGANAGADTFLSYGKNSNLEKSNFVNYGKTFNEGVDTFREYGKGSHNQLTGFKAYGLNTTFKDYARKGVTFSQYTKPSSSGDALVRKVRGKSENKRGFSGKFFREYMLREGKVMRMPDIRDKMPARSFLPRVISSKLPFSSDGLNELKRVFGASDDSGMEGVLVNALAECERAASPGETKRCVGSVEDMIDFATSVLGHNVVVRTTKNVNGSKKNVMIGKIKAINGGKSTLSVSCHQSLYPYLLYYCHSVPKVRVYIAEILDVDTKAKMNDGLAICHEDTSAWSPGHGAFVALGSSPGNIEICHWIFENDMSWTTAD